MNKYIRNEIKLLALSRNWSYFIIPSDLGYWVYECKFGKTINHHNSLYEAGYVVKNLINDVALRKFVNAANAGFEY